MTDGPLIRFAQVSHRYPGAASDNLHAVDFELAAGEMAFLTGASGAGKSTLLKLIALLARPRAGTISVAGTALHTLPARAIPAHRRQFGMIFQNFSLLTDRSVFDNVAMPLIIRGHSGDDIGRRVRGALDAVGLRGRERDWPLQLSGGEQQRVGIARAIVARPKLLIADEPTGNLDPDMAADVMQLFQRFNEVGVSVLVATHAWALIERLPYRILRLEDGHLRPHRDAVAGPA